MAPSIPTTVPSKLYAGTTWVWDRSYSAFPTGIWTATARVVGSSAKLEIVASVSGNSHRFTASAAITAPITAGEYRVLVRVTDGASTYTAEDVRVTVAPDPATVAVGDQQTYNERMLALCDERLLGRITEDMRSYTIHGRSVDTFTPAEILPIRNAFATAVRSERGMGRRSVKVAFPCA